MKRIMLLSLLLVIAMSNDSWAQSVEYYLNRGLERYNVSDFKGALTYFEKGYELATVMRKKQAMGVFLGYIGNVYRNLGDYPKAFHFYEGSLRIHREIRDRRGEGSDLGNIGNAYSNLGDYPKAISYYEQAIKIYGEIREKKGEGAILVNIGTAYWNLGDYSKAFAYYERSLKISKEMRDRRGEGSNLGNIGLIYSDLGNYSRALTYYEQAIKIHREIGDKKKEADVLSNSGVVYNNLGDYSKAISCYSQTLKIDREIGDKKGEAGTLNNMGIVYDSLGDYSKALSYYEQSLKITMQIGDRQGQGSTLGNIGLAYKNLRDYSKALSYCEQCLRIRKEIGVSTKGVESNMGDINLTQGRFKEAYEIFKKLNDPISLGRYYLIIGDYKRAQDEFSRSLKIEAVKEMPTGEFLFADYVGLGLANEGLTEYRKAKEYYQKGISLVEKQRGTLALAERERFLEAKMQGFSRLEPYEGMIRVLLNQNDKESQKEALFYAERAKSKVFMEMLATRALKGKTEEDRSILEEEKAYQQDLWTLRKRIEAMERHGGKAPTGEFDRLKKEFEQKETEYEQFVREVKLNNSELASLITVSPMRTENIQSLLNKETTLLEYYTTKDTLYAWLLTKDDIKVYKIPITENVLNDKVNKFLLPSMSTRGVKVAPVITLGVGDEYKKETSEREGEKNRENFVKAAVEIYRMIMAPLAKEIQTKNMIIVPHGVLHKIPFSTLTDGKKYMVDAYAISMLPAASVLEHVIKKRKVGQERALIFANPKTDYTSLEFAEIEGKTILELFPQSDLYYREKATETTTKNLASQFQIIHFATHGEFNERQPLQSGLFLTKDEENDGYLQVHEIFGMDLRSANLVTLSACETALSKIQGGDDLVGLSRGFIYSGSPSLLATLWRVDDPATAKFMEFFYKNWKSGMNKPEALRQAQIKLRNIPQYSHPYYWAPFVMTGDWR